MSDRTTDQPSSSPLPSNIAASVEVIGSSHYCILRSLDLVELTVTLSALVGQYGWIPTGGLTIDSVSGHVLYYYQALYQPNSLSQR